MNELKMKRIYESAEPTDGTRILVDRLWPRGISKERAALTRWEKEITPSPELRKWFGHEPERFATFTELYRKELDANPAGDGFVSEIRDFLNEGDVTLLYAAKDEERNNAVVMRDWLMEKLAGKA